MNKQMYLAALEKYEKILDWHGAQPMSAPHELFIEDQMAQLDHILTMLPKMRVFLDNDDYGKLNRWLGFIQGVLWAQGLATLGGLRRDNKATEP
jgi:hypothetical protein